MTKTSSSFDALACASSGKSSQKFIKGEPLNSSVDELSDLIKPLTLQNFVRDKMMNNNKGSKKRSKSKLG